MSHGAAPNPARIVLVGFMAAGKSTVGPALADRLGWSFVDFDTAIEQRTGQSPGKLIREQGEAAFRRLEAELTDALADRAGVVLAPGGGWVTRPGLAERLGPGTVRVWLRSSPEEAVRRASTDGVDRPLLGSEAGRLDRARALYRAREPLYREAEIEVDTEVGTPAEIVEEILRRLASYREADER